jgi:hypothetical protein
VLEHVKKHSSANSRITAGQLARLRPYQWKKGQSGNPGGRPKKLTCKLEQLLDKKIPGDKTGKTYAEALIEQMLHRAMKKSDFLIREIFDRVEGKVPRALTAEDHGPSQINVSVVHIGEAPANEWEACPDGRYKLRR